MNIKNIVSIFVFLLLYNTHITTPKKLQQTPIFQTLEKIKTYAQTHPEYPDIDNNNWEKPDYTSFYKKYTPSATNRILQFLRIKSKPLWDAKRFKKLLKNIVLFRENNGYMGRFVKRMHPGPGAKYIIWGDIFGAFHSLSRGLQYLHKKKIINNNLKITDNNIYLVFKGNVVDFSPYILETLTIVLKLMEVNPKNVIYIKGSHEEKETWLQFGLKDELKIKTQYVSSEKIPLKRLIDRLFQTLPLALFLTGQSDKTLQAIRLSHAGMQYPELNVKRFPQLFEIENLAQKTEIFNLKDSIDNKTSNVNIQTIVKSPHKKAIPQQGLSFDGKDATANSFLLFSSPTKTFRALHTFFFDAFSIITTKPDFKNWTIALYNQDIREMLGIHKIETYNLSTGNIVSKTYLNLQNQVKKLEAQLEQCKQKKTIPQKKTISAPKTFSETPKVPIKKKIIIGSTIDTTGEFAKLGKSIKDGLNPFVKTMNLTILEDNGKIKSIVKNIRQLIEDKKIDILFAPLLMTTPTLLKPFLKNIACIFPKPSYNNNTKQIINFGPTLDEIAHFSLQYAKEKEKAGKFAFFYQEKVFKTTIENLVKTLDTSTYITVPYDIKSIQLEHKAAKLRNFRPAALFLWVTPSTAKKIIKQIKPLNLTDTIIIGYQIGTPSFKNFLKKNQLIQQYIGIETIPNPHTSNLQIMQECRNNIGQENINIFSAQAYICAKIFDEIIKNIKGNITKESIIAQTETIKEYAFEGLTLHFNPANRSIYNTIWIDTGKKEWIATNIAQTTTKKPQTTKAGTSVREKEIVFGTTMDLRGHLRGASKKTRFAIKHIFNLENQKGGIHGKKLKLISENDDYKPKKAKANIEKMLQNKNIDLILNPIGGPTTQAYIDLIEKGEILVLFPSTGAPVLRNPDLKYVIHFRPSYKSIHVAAIKYVKEKEKAKKIAFVFQEGAASGKSVALAIEKNNINTEDYIKVPYSRGQVSFTQQAEKIKQFEPDVIAFWCQSVILSKIVSKIGAPNLKNTLLLTTEMGSLAALKYMKKIELLDNFINTENIPSPLESKLPIMKQYRQDLKAPDNFLAETYISTKYLIEVLKNIKGPITKKSIVAYMEQTKNYNFGGFMLNFDPRTRQLSNQIWIYKAGREIGKISTEII